MLYYNKRMNMDLACREAIRKLVRENRIIQEKGTEAVESMISFQLISDILIRIMRDFGVDAMVAVIKGVVRINGRTGYLRQDIVKYLADAGYGVRGNVEQVARTKRRNRDS